MIPQNLAIHETKTETAAKEHIEHRQRTGFADLLNRLTAIR